MAASVYKWLLIPFLFPFFGLNSPSKEIYLPHPVYVSVVELNHNAGDKTLEISCKIFTNDFEKTLKQNYKAPIDLVNPKDKIAINNMINVYIQKHLSIKADGKVVGFTYQGYEREEDATYCYFQVDNISSVKKLEFTDSILHDFINEQINILHVTVGGKRKSTKLDFPNTQAVFNF